MKKMKRMLAILTACACTMSLIGCGNGGNNNASTSQTELSGAIATGGSTSLEKVIGGLGEAFMETHTNVDFTYDPTGSGAGITGAAEGTLEIGLSSRALKEEELANNLKETTFALDGIAIIVHPDNPVSDLSLAQIKGLADGSIANWKDVGGADAPVVLIGREAGSGTRDGFESIVDVKDVCKYEQELTSTGAVIAGVAANPNAFGYVSLASLNDTVKSISVDGVAASEETILDGSYQIQRPFVLVTKADAEFTPQTQAFIDFVTSSDASEIITAAGAVPLV